MILFSIITQKAVFLLKSHGVSCVAIFYQYFFVLNNFSRILIPFLLSPQLFSTRFFMFVFKIILTIFSMQELVPFFDLSSRFMVFIFLTQDLYFDIMFLLLSVAVIVVQLPLEP